MAQTGSGNPGNFSKDHEKASAAGKKGGESSSASHGTSHSTGGGSGSGSQGNFANDREKASEAGKKGGPHGHGGS